MRPRRGDIRGSRWSFSPGERPERPGDPAIRRANLRRVAGLFKAYRSRLAAVLGLIFFSALLSFVSPFLVRDIFDKALP
jgi:ATP-binding cassette subfamily B protein